MRTLLRLACVSAAVAWVMSCQQGSGLMPSDQTVYAGGGEAGAPQSSAPGGAGSAEGGGGEAGDPSPPDPPPDLQLGLVAYYPLRGDAQDQSGYGRHGDIQGATWCPDRFGTEHSAACFDWHGYVVASGTGLPEGDSPRTVTAWVSPDAEGSDPYKGNAFTSWGSGDCVGKMFGLGNYLNKLSLWVGCADFQSSLALPLGQWSFVAVRWEPPQVTVWVDDSMDQKNSEYIDTAPGKLWMGVESINDGSTFRHWYKGSLSELRIYNRALSDTEIGLLKAGEQ